MALPLFLEEDGASSNSESDSTFAGAFFLGAGFAGGGESIISMSESSSTFAGAFFAAGAARFLGGGTISSSLSCLTASFEVDGTAEAGFLVSTGFFASAAFFGFAAGLLGLKSSSESYSALGFLKPSLACFFLPFLFPVSPSAAQSLASQSSHVC